MKRYIIRAGAIVSVLAFTLLAAPTAGAAPNVAAEVLLDGLSSPKGLATDRIGNPVVAQGAFGPPGPVLVVPQFGRNRGQAVPVTEPLSLVDVAVSPRDGSGWGIGFGPTENGLLYHQLRDGTIEVVLDITAYQATDPDPFDQEGIPGESNPYGLTVDRRGDALVADAAGNDLLRVTADGQASTVARFDTELVSTDHLGPDSGLPPALPAESVPTTVTVGRDGTIYVGELKGFPFRPGSSKVWRIDGRANGAVCSVNTPSAGCRVHQDGFTAIQDIALSPFAQELHVLELAVGGVLAFEAGFETGAFPPARLLKSTRQGRVELVPGQLSQPGGIAFGAFGRLYATDGTFGNGRLLRIS